MHDRGAHIAGATRESLATLLQPWRQTRRSVVCPITLHRQIDRKSGKKTKRPPMFVKSGAMVTCIIEVALPTLWRLSSSCPFHNGASPPLPHRATSENRDRLILAPIPYFLAICATAGGSAHHCRNFQRVCSTRSIYPSRRGQDHRCLHARINPQYLDLLTAASPNLYMRPLIFSGIGKIMALHSIKDNDDAA